MRNKEEKFFSKLTLIFSIVFIIFYLLFPGVLKNISVSIFTPTFEYNKERLEGAKTITENELSVLIRPPQIPYDFLIAKNINKLEVQPGHYIFNEKDVPVGVIKEVNKDVVLISLFSGTLSSPILSVNGFLVRSNGLGGGSFVINLPIDVELEIGDDIFLQDLGSRITRVERVELIDKTALKKVYGLIDLNLFEVSSLYVDLDKSLETKEEEITEIQLELLREVDEETKKQFSIEGEILEEE